MEKTTEHDIKVGVAGIIPIQGLGVVIQGFDLGFRAEVISLFLHLGTTKKRMIWLSDQRIIRFLVFSHLVFCVFYLETTKKRMIWRSLASESSAFRGFLHICPSRLIHICARTENTEMSVLSMLCAYSTPLAVVTVAFPVLPRTLLQQSMACGVVDCGRHVHWSGKARAFVGCLDVELNILPRDCKARILCCPL